MLIILRSVSCMGKSTLARIYPSHTTISSDQIRLEMVGDMDAPPRLTSFIWSEINRRLEMRLKEKMVTILDATNLSLKSINKYKKIAREHSVPVKIVSIEPDPVLIGERVEKRLNGEDEGALVTHDVVNNQIEKYYSEREKIQKVYGSDFFEGTWEECKFLLDVMIEQNGHEVVYGETFVIGDIHGCHDELKELLSMIPLNANVYSTGDIIDRGPDSMGCLFTLMNDGRFRGFAMGNHEKAFLEELEGRNCNSTARMRTHEEFKSLNESEKEIIIKFMRTGKPFIVVENPDVGEKVLLTHAGLGKLDAISTGITQCCSEKMNPVGESNTIIGIDCQIHGHMHWQYTGVSSGSVVNNDSGVCYGEYLTAMNVFNREESFKVKSHAQKK